jgi:DNA-binding NarL/FixJ family response regulator
MRPRAAIPAFSFPLSSGGLPGPGAPDRPEGESVRPPGQAWDGPAVRSRGDWHGSTEDVERHTVLIVEDDDHTRCHLMEAVDGAPELRVVGSVGSLAEGRLRLRAEAPDVMLVDLGLPDGSGIELIEEARRLSADTQVLVITVFGDEKSVLSAIEAGARGYLLKDGEPADVCAAVEQLLAGGSPISPAIARHLLRRFQADVPDAPAAPDVPHLSAREAEVLGLVVKGFTFPEIAARLSISAHTVTTHVRRIYRKLEVRSRSEAVYEAMNLGIVKPGD